jgi:hypothetical protein
MSVPCSNKQIVNSESISHIGGQSYERNDTARSQNFGRLH